MKRFLKLYKWELNNELYASIYFAAMLSIYSLEVLLHGERSVDIIIMLEMIIVCYTIALIQKIMFTDHSNYVGKSLIVRTVVWLAISVILVIVPGVLLDWFSDLQAWAMGVFVATMTLCFAMIWIGIHIANKIDTKNLNNMLSNYQKKSID